MEQLNKWLQLISNLAVVGSIVFLAVEVRHNTRVNESQVQAELLQLGHEVHDWKRESNFADLVVKASLNYDELSPSERVQFDTHMFQQFNVWEHAYKVYTRGLMDRSFWNGWNNAFAPRMKEPSWIRVWSEVKPHFAIEFQQHVDSYVPKSEGPLLADCCP